MRKTHLIATALAALIVSSSVAHAEPRKSPLEGQPAVRHRYELRDKRFEVGPAVWFSLNRALRHSIAVGAKLQFHLTDYLALGAEIGYGFGLDTGLAGEIEGTFAPANTKAWETHKSKFSDINLIGDVRVAFTPFAGKMGIFGKLFLAYDFYAFGGFGFAMTKNNTDDAGANETNEGFRPGAVWGFGMHLFFTKWMAMTVEVKDLMFQDNESGQDITRGTSEAELTQKKVLVDSSDRQFKNHFFVGIGFTFLLPGNPKTSN
ncbi:MAG: outer membrane beta-barrel domain-containing protein [Deltaproteobacteria bacterium]|nr:outer membrane beta-barrel domain-containing protein [Deltaproteobacteria bacterium]